MTSTRESTRGFATHDRVAYGGIVDGTGDQSMSTLFSEQTYVLALDGSSERCATTTYNLAVLAWYVYGTPIDQAARTTWGRLGWDAARGRSSPVVFVGGAPTTSASSNGGEASSVEDAPCVFQGTFMGLEEPHGTLDAATLDALFAHVDEESA